MRFGIYGEIDKEISFLFGFLSSNERISTNIFNIRGTCSKTCIAVEPSSTVFQPEPIELALNGSWKISYYRVRFRMVLKFMAYGKVIRRGAATEPNFKSVSIHGTVLTHSQQGSVREVGFS